MQPVFKETMSQNDFASIPSPSLVFPFVASEIPSLMSLRALERSNSLKGALRGLTNLISNSPSLFSVLDFVAWHAMAFDYNLASRLVSQPPSNKPPNESQAETSISIFLSDFRCFHLDDGSYIFHEAVAQSCFSSN